MEHSEVFSNLPPKAVGARLLNGSSGRTLNRPHFVEGSPRKSRLEFRRMMNRSYSTLARDVFARRIMRGWKADDSCAALPSIRNNSVGVRYSSGNPGIKNRHRRTSSGNFEMPKNETMWISQQSARYVIDALSLVNLSVPISSRGPTEMSKNVHFQQ